MGKEFYKCFSCKELFPVNSLTEYAGINAKEFHKYCSKCLEEKKEREKFSDTVCRIFGIKSPGPRIWTERKRLILTYGYTDDIIVNCLKYLYDTKHLKKLQETICLVNPTNVDKMLKWRREQATKALLIGAATNTSTKEYIVPVQENNKVIKEELNPDDWLDDE